MKLFLFLSNGHVKIKYMSKLGFSKLCLFLITGVGVKEVKSSFRRSSKLI